MKAEAGGGGGLEHGPGACRERAKVLQPSPRRAAATEGAPGQRGCVPPPAGQRGTAPRRNRAPVFKAALGPLGMPRVSQAGRRRRRRWLPIPAAAPGCPLPKRTGLAQPPRKGRGEKLCHSHEFTTIFGGLPGALPTLRAKAGGGPARGQRHGAALGRVGHHGSAQRRCSALARRRWPGRSRGLGRDDAVLGWSAAAADVIPNRGMFAATPEAAQAQGGSC